MTAIVGPSGAGKSTILNLVPRFWDVRADRITIGGVDVRDIPESELSGLVTVVFQQVHLLSGTIFDNIALGREGASLAEVEAAARAFCRASSRSSAVSFGKSSSFSTMGKRRHSRAGSLGRCRHCRSKKTS